MEIFISVENYPHNDDHSKIYDYSSHDDGQFHIFESPVYFKKGLAFLMFVCPCYMLDQVSF